MTTQEGRSARSGAGGGSFTFPPSDTSDSTEVPFSRPFSGDTRRSRRVERTGRKEPPRHRASPVPRMTASPNSPPNGETVSDASFDEQRYLRDYTTHRVRGVVDELRYNIVDGEPDWADLRFCVARARYQLELLETVLDEELGDDLELRLSEDLEEMRQ